MQPVTGQLKRRGLKFSFVVLVIVAGLSLGCSIGSLMVQSPTPTPTRFKTPQPTFTFPPYWTPTFAGPGRTPTPTSTPTPTDTATLTPTKEQPQEAAVSSQATEAPPAPVEPSSTPTPEEPTATPTPAFPFNVVYYKHDTGSPGETRMTAWIRVDYSPGKFKTLSGFQVKALAPDGNSYLSEVSGAGPGDSTVKGTGDNHNMNTKLEFRPYTPGAYKVYLVEGDVQVSPEVEFTMAEEPRQYIHFDFFKQE
jgi:hypothetical protein